MKVSKQIGSIMKTRVGGGSAKFLLQPTNKDGGQELLYFYWATHAALAMALALLPEMVLRAFATTMQESALLLPMLLLYSAGTRHDGSLSPPSLLLLPLFTFPHFWPAASTRVATYSGNQIKSLPRKKRVARLASCSRSQD